MLVWSKTESEPQSMEIGCNKLVHINKANNLVQHGNCQVSGTFTVQSCYAMRKCKDSL